MAFKPANATPIESRPNFSSLLDEAPTEVIFAPPIPVGSYVAVVQPGWEKGSFPKTGNEYHQFNLKILQPLEDVGTDELEAYGDVSGVVLPYKFTITEKAVSYLDDFHQSCGLDLSKLKGVSRRLRNDEVANSAVGIYIKHRPWSDGSGKVAAEIARFFRVTEE